MDNTEQLHEVLAILRCQLGDWSRFMSLHERYHGRILYYLRRLIPDAHLAEDVLQEVWMAVIRQIGKLQIPEAFSVWLYRTARNMAIQKLRRRRMEIPIDGVEEGPAESEQSPEDFTAEQAQQIHACLGNLDLRHREILSLRFMEQMSYERIAAVLECSIGTVKSRLYHAKQRLRREMEKLDDYQP